MRALWRAEIGTVGVRKLGQLCWGKCSNILGGPKALNATTSSAPISAKEE